VVVVMLFLLLLLLNLLLLLLLFLLSVSPWKFRGRGDADETCLRETSVGLGTTLGNFKKCVLQMFILEFILDLTFGFNPTKFAVRCGLNNKL
jgi:hypothetical protein